MSILLNFAPKTAYRTVEIRWFPYTDADWKTYTAVRSDCAKLRNHLVSVHARIRRLGWKWPDYDTLERSVRGKFLALGAQSTQMIVKDFCDDINSMTKLRRVQIAAGEKIIAKYPWRTSKYRDVPYSNQSAVYRDGVLRLSNSVRRGSAPLFITLPTGRELPGRIMEVTLAYGTVRIICEIDETKSPVRGPLVGVDLGVNTILAATDGSKAVLVSGREAKSIVRYRNKTHAEMLSRIDRCKKGSRRRNRLSIAKRRMHEKSSRKLRDVLHKATRAVANAFPNSPVAVGEPFNRAADNIGRVPAQQISQASNGRLTAQLNYKMSGITEVKESYSSQTCPVCGCRRKCRRVYTCKRCGFTAPRDVVGAVNIRSIGLYGEMRTNQSVPMAVIWVRPLRKYSGTPKVVPDRPVGTTAHDAYKNASRVAR